MVPRAKGLNRFSVSLAPRMALPDGVRAGAAGLASSFFPWSSRVAWNRAAQPSTPKQPSTWSRAKALAAPTLPNFDAQAPTTTGVASATTMSRRTSAAFVVASSPFACFEPPTAPVRARTETLPTNVRSASEHTASTPKHAALSQKTGLLRNAPPAAVEQNAPRSTPAFSQRSNSQSTVRAPRRSQASATDVEKSMPARCRATSMTATGATESGDSSAR